jgi:hypothetical protein
MAEKKGLVHVELFAVTKPFDSKYKNDAKLKAAMKAAAEKAICTSGLLTTKGAASADMKEFSLGGTVTKLAQETKGSKPIIRAEVMIQAAAMPGRSMFANASGGADYENPNPRKLDDQVKTLLTDLIDDLIVRKVNGKIEERIGQK